MSGFGLNESSPVEAKIKTLEPSPKGIAADEAGKPTEQGGKPTEQAGKPTQQARTAPGLPTPESTPGPDTGRLEADKARRKEEAAKVPEVLASDSPSGVDTTDVRVNKGKDPVTSSQSAITPDASPENAPDNGQRGYTDEQKMAAERVLKCGASQYYKILNVPDPCPKQESHKAYEKLAQLLHPDKNKYSGANEAFKSRPNSGLFLRDI